MPDREYIIAESTWQTVRATPYDVAVLPWGATEAHNYHLPYATDTIQCDAVAAAAARLAWEEGARIAVLPTVPFGVNTGQLDIKLCINMNPSTQAAVLADVASSLAGQGIRKLVILNGHGGNDFRGIIRELQPRTCVFLSSIDWYKCVDPRPFFDEPGDHAGELETSVMMHVSPSLVRPLSEAGPGDERRSRLKALREGRAWAPRRWTSVTNDTGIGNPAAATAAKGERYLGAVARYIADYLVELSAVDLEDLYA